MLPPHWTYPSRIEDQSWLIQTRERFLAGEELDSRVPPVVAASWHRARANGIDPELGTVPMAISRDALSSLLSELEVARLGIPLVSMAGLWLQGTGHAVLLCDGMGTVLHLDGDRGLLDAAEGIGCVSGASWAETSAGNSGVGTSLFLGQPIHFAWSEHFCAGWQDWTCAAVPVADPETGRPTAVLTLAGYRSAPTVRTLQMALDLSHQLQVLLEGQAAVRRNDLFTRALRRQAALPGETVLALDRGGRVVWASDRGVLLRPGRAELPVPLAAWPGLAGLADHLDPDRSGEYHVQGAAGTVLATVQPVRQGNQWLGHLVVLSRRARRAAPTQPPAPPVVVARAGERRILLRPDQVLLARSRGSTVELLTTEGEYAADCRRLTQLEHQLAPHGFFRAGRTALVNLSRVREVLPMFNRTVRLVLADRRQTEVSVSRRRTTALRRLLHF